MHKMEYLNCDIEYLKSHGGIFTAKEISSQPALWLETYTKLVRERSAISVFLHKVLGQEFPYVIHYTPRGLFYGVQADSAYFLRPFR
jgi:hypothetical protein